MTCALHGLGDGATLAGQRIQIWASTTEEYERDPQGDGTKSGVALMLQK